MTHTIPQVGAPDPERRNSPILDDEDEELPTELEVETGVCYFNSLSYPLGSYVRSGSELLHCEERGVWVGEFHFGISLTCGVFLHVVCGLEILV
jgi:hypothetical protein